MTCSLCITPCVLHIQLLTAYAHYPLNMHAACCEYKLLTAYTAHRMNTLLTVCTRCLLCAILGNLDELLEKVG